MPSSPLSQAAASETTESASQAPVRSEEIKDTGLSQAEENKDTELSSERPLPVVEEAEEVEEVEESEPSSIPSCPVFPLKSESRGSPREQSLLLGEGRDSIDSMGNNTPRSQQPLLFDQEGKNTQSTSWRPPETIDEERENTGLSDVSQLQQSVWESLECNSRLCKFLGLAVFLLIAGFVLIMFGFMGAQKLPATFMQFNIRVNNVDDWVPCEGKSWVKVICPSQSVVARKWSYAACVAVHNPGIFGIQEGLYSQIEDTTSILKDSHDLDYAYVGIGRAGAGFDSETSAMFYKRSDWTVEATGNFMFSKTPSIIGSYYSDAAVKMISTWAVFVSRAGDGRRFLGVTTHLDPYNPSVREAQAKQLRDTVNVLLQIYSCTQVVLLGDLNSGAEELPHHIFEARWVDAYKADHGEYGPHSFTFHDWQGPAYKPEGTGARPSHPNQTLSDPDSPVDFIMFGNVDARSFFSVGPISAGPSPRITVQQGSTLVDKSHYLGNWPSDHYPVVADLQIPVISYWSEAPGYAWESAPKGAPLPLHSISSGETGNGGFVGRHISSGSAGEILASSGVVDWLHVQGYKEAAASTEIEALVLRGAAKKRWKSVKSGDRVPLGAVFSGFNTKDWNMYVARVLIDGQYQTCKMNSDGTELGMLGNLWCYYDEEYYKGELLIITHPKLDVSNVNV